MIITRHTHLEAPPEPWTTTWEELSSMLSAPPMLVDDKHAAPLWSPWEYESGAKRAEARYCTAIHAAVLDFDGPKGTGLPLETIGTVIGRLMQRGLAAALHASHSAIAVHSAGRTKFRAVIPFSEPLLASQWPIVFSGLQTIFPEIDATAKSVGRKFFVPSSPAYGPHAWGVVLPGRVGKAEEIVSTRRRATAKDLVRLAKEWRRGGRRDPELADALEWIAAGEPYAVHPGRNERTWTLVSGILRDCPWLEPGSLAELFAPSLSRMAAFPGEPASELPPVAEMAERAAGYVASAHREASTAGPHVLVSPTGSAYWVRAPGNVERGWIGPFSGDSVDTQIAHTLDGRIPLTYQTPNGGTKAIPRAEIMRSYGRVVQEHVTVLGTATSIFDEPTGRFEEAACPVLPVEPAYSPVVDGYLRVLADDSPEKHADLQTWLSLLTDLTRPLVALVFIGSAGAGKSLFAECVASLWGEPPVSEIEATGPWSGSLLRCPIVFADEYISSDTKKLRQLIQARSITITRKFLPNVEARGCVRVIVAANSDQVLHFGDDFDHNDLAATRARLYVLGVTPSAVSYSRAYAPAIKLEFAAHVAWLKAHVPASNERFGIVSRAESAHALDKLSTRGGARGDVCWWIVSTLEMRPALSMRLFRVWDDRHVAISLPEILKTWEERVQAKRPTLRQLRQAMGVLGAQSMHTRWGNLWLVPLDRVQTWAEDMGWTQAVHELAQAMRAQDDRAPVVSNVTQIRPLTAVS